MPKITLDTSVLYQALHSRRGASYQILQFIRQEQLTVSLTVPVFFEYQEVLYRPESLRDLELTRGEVDAVLDLFSKTTPWLKKALPFWHEKVEL